MDLGPPVTIVLINDPEPGIPPRMEALRRHNTEPQIMLPAWQPAGPPIHYLPNFRGFGDEKRDSILPPLKHPFPQSSQYKSQASPPRRVTLPSLLDILNPEPIFVIPQAPVDEEAHTPEMHEDLGGLANRGAGCRVQATGTNSPSPFSTPGVRTPEIHNNTPMQPNAKENRHGPVQACNGESCAKCGVALEDAVLSWDAVGGWKCQDCWTADLDARSGKSTRSPWKCGYCDAGPPATFGWNAQGRKTCIGCRCRLEGHRD
ncbi:hypothetical protein PsYK624_090220 [Phanerochaete sordida]|uniref:Uncharacterized protein n=1 Tax=Phanerochaete sordida TaxID=48140 RepID=A0A9P3GEH4_9APHY|nr:hypothetical protein PsYK624_090220 [Phanerochaete sordida]